MVDQYLNSFIAIQSQLSTIIEEKSILVNEIEDELNAQDRSGKILKYINALEDKIEASEAFINERASIESGMRKTMLESLYNYKIKLKSNEKEIKALQILNDSIVKANMGLVQQQETLKMEKENLTGVYRSLQKDYQKKQDVIEKKEELLEKAQELQDKKYCYLIQKKDYQFEEVNPLGNHIIRLSSKIKVKQILSIHPITSFKLHERKGTTVIQITDWDEFWNANNILLIRSKINNCYLI